jgi:NADH:ubiquinone reductase (non-electrogenic)
VPLVNGAVAGRAVTDTVSAHPASVEAPVVILGGGFGGLYTALALAEQRQHPPILLIEPRDRFLFLPLLYELLSGELRSWEVAPRYDMLLAGKGVAWLQDRVDRIDTGARTLHTSGGRQLRFSQLVIACGATTAHFGIPGVAEHALGFRTLADVERLQRLVQQLRQSERPLQRLAVVGAGASGVELACKLADLLAGSRTTIELVEQGHQLLPQARAFNREQAERALLQRDVRLRTNTKVAAVASDHIDVVAPGGREQLPVAGVIWTAGLRFEPPLIEPAPARDSRGRLLCEPSLRLEGQRQLFAIGDIAAISGHANANDDEESDAGYPPLPLNAQVAFQQAGCLARNLLEARSGGQLETFRYRDLGEMMSLGVGDASLTGGGFTLAGPAAFQLRKLAYLTRLPGRSHQVRVAAGWLANLPG